MVPVVPTNVGTTVKMTVLVVVKEPRHLLLIGINTNHSWRKDLNKIEF